MRGAIKPGKRTQPSDSQAAFRELSRGRRAKLAKAAGATLVKAHQWARGEEVGDVAKALETQVKAHLAKRKK
jgi:hypothetical protein